jgi:hypothetical protein
MTGDNMAQNQHLRDEIREELKVRVMGRFYGHISPDDEEPAREVQIVKLYLVLAGDGCPGCEQAIEEYKKEIDAGEIEVLDPQTSDKAIEMVTALGCYALPALIGEDADGDYVVVDHTT